MFQLFKSSSKQVASSPIDWSLIGVDFHSHLLPSVDDGVRSIEDSYTILKRMKEMGYQTIYISPHINEAFSNTKASLIGRFQEFKENELISSLDLNLGLISEYLLEEQFESLIENDELLTFGDKHILVETSMNYDFPFVRTYIYQLIQKGYKPILAHPERYRYIYTQKNALDTYEEMREWGLRFQLNLFSLAGAYGAESKKMAETLIDNELYSYACTDIHLPHQMKHFEELKNSLFLRRFVESEHFKNSYFI